MNFDFRGTRSEASERASQSLSARGVVRISRVFPEIGSLKLGKMRIYFTCDPSSSDEKFKMTYPRIYIDEHVTREDAYLRISENAKYKNVYIYNQATV